LQETRNSLRWRLGVCAALAFTLIALYPQAHFQRVRGPQYHGAYYIYHPDENAYATYVNALIEGRPRRNDPYSGRVDQPGAPLPESLFSIQFVPAYALALPARLFNLSTNTIFILLAPLVAFAAVLALFWLVGRVTKDERLAATAALFIVSMGGLARGQYLVRKLGGVATPYIFLPFLRRYEPAFAFPIFFLFCGLVWLMLNSPSKSRVRGAAIGAALAFAVLVFSYYFLWTAAAAWLLSLTLVWLIMRPEDFRRDLRRLAELGALMLPALLAYAYLLAHRAGSIDEQQALTRSHTPDLFRPPMMLCVMLLAAIVFAFWQRWLARNDRAALFTTALALAPLLMFNQQVLTGRSLQPIHYEQFIANYVAVLALVLTGAVLWRGWTGGRRKIPALLLAGIALVSLARGLQEVRNGANSTLEFSTTVDESRPAALRLAELARTAPDGGAAPTKVVLVLSPSSFMVSDTLAITAPQPVLWARHMFSYSALTPAENKERFYKQLYFSDVDQQALRAATYEQIYFRMVVFGWERVINGLNANWRPVTEAEMQAATEDYAHYVATFDRERAAQPTLAYVIAPATGLTDFSRVDHWYERDAGERAGNYIIYRVSLRP
jgi:hypothetical protein